MAQLNLHPCAAKMIWLSEQPQGGGEWRNAMCGFLDDLGKNCIVAGGSLIGHIKGIATVSGSICLRLSLVSLHQPVTIEGVVPDGTNELQLTLNVLVFGMSADELTVTLATTRDQALRSWAGSIEVESFPAATDYPLAFHGAGS